MKLTKHQTNIMLYLARRYKTQSYNQWVKPVEASLACGSNYSQQKNSSWSLPKLRTLVKKGLLECQTYPNPVSGSDAYMFKLVPDTKIAFKLLLKV